MKTNTFLHQKEKKKSFDKKKKMVETIPRHVKDVDVMIDRDIWTALDGDLYTESVRDHLDKIDDEMESKNPFFFFCFFYFFILLFFIFA